MIFVSGRWRGWRRARRSRGSGGIADQPLVRFKMVGTPARDRQRVCGADWRPQAARFVGRSRRLAAGPGVVRFFYAAGLAAELAERGVKVDYRSSGSSPIARG